MAKPDSSAKTSVMTLRSWMWRAFVQSALIPLILVETVLVAAYLLTNMAIRDAQIEHLRESALVDLQSAARQEAALISQRLRTVSELTDIFARRVQDALLAQRYLDNPLERQRLQRNAEGVLFSPDDNGRAASFYSGLTPPEQQDMERVLRLTQLDGLMKAIEQSNPLVASIYFNTHDSYNRIWPWFFTPDQYPPDMDIPAYNFYYLADAEHNPGRRVVWTDIYVDPAGHGWMMSSLAPVYRGEFLEGVAGLDITVSQILEEISALQVPWGGYAMLVSEELNIMALPSAGEADLGLSELTSHSYDEAISQEVFKPEDFNLASREDTQRLADALLAQRDGVKPVSLGGRRQLAAWAEIPETGWQLVTLVDEEAVFSRTNQLARHFQNIGYLLIAGLVLFYLLFFAGMWWRSRQLSQQLQTPIAGVGRMLERIGQGERHPQRPAAALLELQQMAEHAVRLGGQLESSEQQRQSVLEQLERVLDSTTESLWEVDRHTRQITIQGRLAEWLGLGRPSLELESFLGLIHPDDLGVARSSLLPDSTSQRLQAEYRLHNPAGEYRWLLGRGRIEATDSHGRPQRIVGTHVDIDALKATEQALRSASQQAQSANIAKSRFLSSMSHELRTPLNAVLGFAQLLALDLEDAKADDRQINQVNEILRAGQHLSLLIDDVLDLARIEAERPEVRLETVDAAQIMRESLEQVRLDLEAAGLQIDSLPPPGPVWVTAEPRRLRQILLNLLSNAIKYNRPGGRVGLDCRRVGGYWQLRVSDSGRGIAAERQHLLFKPFQRLGHENGTIKGTGIGLALCRELAGLMHAEMGFESQESIGSHFWIELPVAAEMISITQEAGAPLLDVVYVEDDRSSQMLVQHALAEMARVTLIGNGVEALDRIVERPPQVLLLDIDLPDMQGDRLLRTLRSSARTRDLPVIVISAGALPADRERVSDLGVLAYLTKPLQLPELREAMQQAVRLLGRR